jgi:hypothetical protein
LFFSSMLKVRFMFCVHNIRAFKFVHRVTLTNKFYMFHCFLLTYYQLCFSLKNSFQHFLYDIFSYIGGVVLHSLNFCWRTFARCSILGWQLLQYCEHPCLSFLSYIISPEKSALRQIGTILCISCLFSLASWGSFLSSPTFLQLYLDICITP